MIGIAMPSFSAPFLLRQFVDQRIQWRLILCSSSIHIYKYSAAYGVLESKLLVQVAL